MTASLMETGSRTADCPALTAAARSAVYARRAESRFPKPLRIGRGAVRWVEQEVVDFIAGRRCCGAEQPTAEPDPVEAPSHPPCPRESAARTVRAGEPVAAEQIGLAAIDVVEGTSRRQLTRQIDGILEMAT